MAGIPAPSVDGEGGWLSGPTDVGQAAMGVDLLVRARGTRVTRSGTPRRRHLRVGFAIASGPRPTGCRQARTELGHLIDTLIDNHQRSPCGAASPFISSRRMSSGPRRAGDRRTFRDLLLGDALEGRESAVEACLALVAIRPGSPAGRSWEPACRYRMRKHELTLSPVRTLSRTTAYPTMDRKRLTIQLGATVRANEFSRGQTILIASADREAQRLLTSAGDLGRLFKHSER